MSEETADDDEGSEGVASCHQWVLPAIENKGLWERYRPTYVHGHIKLTVFAQLDI